MTADFVELYRELQRQEAAHKQASEILKQFPKGPHGLTHDNAKRSETYRTARAQAALAFSKIRALNKALLRIDKKAKRATVRREIGRRLTPDDKLALQRVGL